MNYIDLFRATLPETALEVAVLVVVIADLAFLRKAALQTRVAVAALLGVAGCAASLWAVTATGPYALGGDLILTAGGATGVAQAGILVLTALTLLLFIGAGFTRNVGEYVAVVLMAAAGGLLIAAAQDLLVIFIGLELLSLSLYIMTAFAKHSDKSAEAAMKYYLFGGMSAAFLLFGFSYLYGITGSTNLHQIQLAIYTQNAMNAAPMLYVAIVLIAAGLGFKVAAVPFHLWAPDTYEGAPTPAAAFIASVSKVASFALLISIAASASHVFDGQSVASSVTAQVIAAGTGSRPVYLGFSAPWTLILVVFATASMVLGNLAALAQTSVRRLLAYSAIAHAGYMLLGLAFFTKTPVSTDAILYYILSYGLTAIGAFGVVGVVERASGSDKLDAFLGLHKRNP